jgi:iron complex outermembrane recepter protein
MAAPLVAPCARSQVAQDNAVLTASDAFSTQIDQQSIGLYSQTAARGFSPQQAGNLRIEGLYFDQETLITNPCLVHETDMRVGIAAQSFSFPSPTGIADLKLRHPGDAAEFSALLTRGPFESETATLEAQLPAPALNFGVDLCAAYYYNFDLDAARRSRGAIYSATASWHPGGTFEILPFAGLIVGSERDQLPVVYTDGTYPLQAFVERDLLTQKGLGYGWHQLTAGTIVRAQLTEEWRLLAGAFLSQERDPINVNPYFVVQSGGMADYALDVVPPASQQSESGELQLARQFAHTTHEELIEFTARGRNVDRQFGGDQITDFGTINLLAQSNFMELPPQFSSINHDLVRQVDVGVLFEERWHDLGSITLGALGDHYHRRLTFDGEAASEDQLLKSVRFTLRGGPSLLAYGSYVQGVEDSPLAPTNATNRGELPSSSLTWQVDTGIRCLRESCTAAHLRALRLDSGRGATGVGQFRARRSGPARAVADTAAAEVDTQSGGDHARGIPHCRNSALHFVWRRDVAAGDPMVPG